MRCSLFQMSYYSLSRKSRFVPEETMNSIGRLLRVFLASLLSSFVVFMSVSVIPVWFVCRSVSCESTIGRCIYPS